VGRGLSFGERVEIDRWWHARHRGQSSESMRSLAGRIGRDVSVISREVARNGSGKFGYHAIWAQPKADQRRRRPRQARLVAQPLLRTLVLGKLRRGWSPQQIAGWLARMFPDRPELLVSHETIYQAIYVQSRGNLRAELREQVALRSGRLRRRPRAQPGGPVRSRRPWLGLNVSERPAEAADRAVPGHWEGDLVIGAAGKSAIVTLVERSTRFVLLRHLPTGRSSEPVIAAISEAIGALPAQLRRSLTWDQGNEMSGHLTFTVATSCPVYFCDPHSPWQRGSNENTNGLLRQYFPKGRTDFNALTQTDLDDVAELLNTRPRKTLAWHTPAEKLDELLHA
jgi:transposase, IS30 family